MSDRRTGRPNLLQERTKVFALRIIRLCRSLPEGRVESIIASQLMRCGTSVGANYRSACRARSAAEFRAKLGIVEEETDESIYWLELLADSAILPRDLLSELINEAHEILSMVVSSIRTSRSRSEEAKTIRRQPR